MYTLATPGPAQPGPLKTSETQPRGCREPFGPFSGVVQIAARRGAIPLLKEGKESAPKRPKAKQLATPPRRAEAPSASYGRLQDLQDDQPTLTKARPGAAAAVGTSSLALARAAAAGNSPCI